MTMKTRREGPKRQIIPEPVDRCYDCVNFPKGGRNRGECTLIGEIVRGSNKDRPCFRRRAVGHVER